MDKDLRNRTRPLRKTKKLRSRRLPKRYPILRTATILALIILSMSSLSKFSVNGQTYNLKYDLGYVGTPFAGGTISVASNFTNTGQLTVRVTSISFASDFWSNGTRQVISGFPFNLTTGMNRMVDTAVLIPTSASIGNHQITATATWQFSNSSRWYAASSISASLTVMVSQTIGSLFNGMGTYYGMLIRPGVALAVVVAVLVVFLVVRQRRKPKPGVPYQLVLRELKSLMSIDILRSRSHPHDPN